MLDVYSLYKSEKPALVIYDSPHSGTNYPDDFNHIGDDLLLRGCEDNYVDELFAGVEKLQADLLCAQFPRSYIDVNRADDDIDALLLDKPWEGDIRATPRSQAGYGLVRRLIKPNVFLYDRKLTQDEITKRLYSYYTPYHEKLEEIIYNAYKHHGSVWHINCHSMPNETAKPNRVLGLSTGQRQSADFVLGDRDGTTCDSAFTRAVRDFIRELGYNVTINDPFKGVEVIKRHSQPARGIHSIQIEINKSLYMNEHTLEKHSGFADTKATIDNIAVFIQSYAENNI